MKRLSVRYLAGLIDGEGCIDFQVGKDTGFGLYIRPRVRITLVCSAEVLLKLVQNNFDGNLDFRKGSGTFSDSWTWSLTSKSDVNKFLGKIIKHLIIKKEQAKFALWWLDNMSGRHRRSEGYQKIEKIRRFAYDEMKRLKRDSQRLSERAIQTIESMR